MSLFLTRRSDLSRDAFMAYWTISHVPLARRVMGGSGHVRRYVQQYALAGLPDDLPLASYDGVMEAWFDDMEALSGAMALASASTVLAEDEARFLDRSKTVMMITRERSDLWS